MMPWRRAASAVVESSIDTTATPISHHSKNTKFKQITIAMRGMPIESTTNDAGFGHCSANDLTMAPCVA